MTAVGSALGGNTFNGAWLTTAEQAAVVGFPAQETYSGPVSEPHGPEPTGEPLVRNEALTGQPAGPGYPSQPIPEIGAGGLISDTVAELGYSGPVASFDAQTEPFAPSGPVADTHGLDTGGTYRTEHVPMPRSPGWYRRTAVMQTFNRQSFVTDDAGWRQNIPNARQDLNQDQGQALDAATRWLPYSERPIQAKFAAEAYPILDAPGGYAPSGELAPPTQMGGQGNLVYEAPPDPSVNTTAAASQVTAPGAESWMEFIR